MKRTTQIIINWLPVVLWICCIFLFSTGWFSSEHTSQILEPLLRFLVPQITAVEIQTIHILIRKAAHITEYCITSILVFHSFRNTSQNQNLWRWAAYSLVIILITALTDEYHQSFVATRTSSIIDVGIDMAGGILGQGISIIDHQLRYIRKRNPVEH